MKSILILGSLLLADTVGAGSAGTTQGSTSTTTGSSNTKFNPIENLFQPLKRSRNEPENDTTKTKKNFQIPQGPDPNAPTPEEREAEGLARRERNRQRRAKVADAMKKVRPDASKIEKLSTQEVNELSENHPNEFRKLWGGSGSSGGNMIDYADPGDDYDMWQQAYRMLGGFIDCDHQKSEGSGDQGGSGDGDGQGACSRWMMWASYVDPNYQGYGYDEYFGDEPVGVLDCHKPDTEWVLLGVYRQEFYQFIEQISKHLWAIDEYEYVVALAGLAYMTDYDCFYVGNDASGNVLYAGVAPQPLGGYQMGLYTDNLCLVKDEESGMTYDDFGLQNDIDLGSKDATDDDGKSWAYEWWYDTQEYSLTQLNGVYEQYMYCTSCIDYPTYQDGYVIGDTGYDDDDLINQCWKFYSHDSFTCESDCIALGHAQGTILSVTVGNKMYGEPLESFYSSVEIESLSGGTMAKESKLTRLMANVFVTFSFIVFVATFLAFAVARRSRYRESRSSKSRRLLEDDRGTDGKYSRSRRSSSRRSSSRRKDDDGVFRSSRDDKSRKTRSKSSSRRKSSSRKPSSRKDYGDDNARRSRSRSRKRSSSRGRQTDEY
uniref:BZIP domain-containing protein n=1 Tax=Pseudo-nitzschia australis TaxID=44445 RepID=A0A7S4ALH6_9STRA|mmetsp:Transcript_6765/g.14411  ORF Transcript_6765/g.14411 Transcript_6765/m.14411 type:complete len:601 (-) Transcript_6765:324-2126(-)|eukprot:CAMPEP_0168178292 /NCGR_PEP_ID=MMETSP0139_2-20121125/9017_1 /TAXON_ID=44445 /ORGANISM="Pseudo-nitzschia australis, Strain 10249 10 AB" /LENGTH=600 /DNA_ID=CAMNT_0008097615 /DNA_START=316 /DNA_END=2118 /DNA_ORIENTATION=-